MHVTLWRYRRARNHGLEPGHLNWRVYLDNRFRTIWLRTLVLVGWLLMIPPITPAMEEGVYVGSDGRPAKVGVEDPLYAWTIYRRYATAAECERMEAKLSAQSLKLDPASATAAAYSFAKCVEDSDPQLQRNSEPVPH